MISDRVGEGVAAPPYCGRRTAVRGTAVAVATVLAGCTDVDRTAVTPRGADRDGYARGRLAHRPGHAGRSEEDGAIGNVELDVDGGRPAALHVPDVDGPMRLVLLLHGAGGEPERTRQLLVPYARRHRLLLLAPASRAATWDVVQGGFGADVETIDQLLQRTAEQYPVDGMTVAGFSDGASYALTLGISNGDVFDSVIAFSPGFAAAQVRHGRPRFFVSHGTDDRVLPVDRCSRRLVPALESQGYDVTYDEFDGGHEVPSAVRRQAVDWLR